MIRVSVFYPNKPGNRFDFEYYTKVHIPRSTELLAPAVREVSVEIGVSGATAETPPAFWAIAGFTSESIEAFAHVFLPHAAELRGDIPNYSDIEPIIQVSRLSAFLPSRR